MLPTIRPQRARPGNIQPVHTGPPDQRVKASMTMLAFTHVTGSRSTPSPARLEAAGLHHDVGPTCAASASSSTLSPATGAATADLVSIGAATLGRHPDAAVGHAARVAVVYAPPRHPLPARQAYRPSQLVLAQPGPDPGSDQRLHIQRRRRIHDSHTLATPLPPTPAGTRPLRPLEESCPARRSQPPPRPLVEAHR